LLKKITKNKTSAENDILELFNLKAQKSLLEKRETELKTRISEYVTSHVSPDTKKNYTYFVNAPNGKRVMFQKQARKKIELNEENAISMLRKKKLLSPIITVERIAEEVTQDQILDALIDAGYDDYIDIVETIDESALEELVMNGKLTQAEFEKMCDININYAIICTEEKEEEIE